MANTVVETSGTVRADGTLELDQKVTVPPGKVKVPVESIGSATPSLEARFRELVRQWQEATLLMSSITDMATHPAYQQIIGRARKWDATNSVRHDSCYRVRAGWTD